MSKTFEKFFFEDYRDDLDPIEENKLFDQMEKELLIESVLNESSSDEYTDEDNNEEDEEEDDDTMTFHNKYDEDPLKTKDKKKSNNKMNKNSNNENEEDQKEEDPEVEYSKNLSPEQKKEKNKKFAMFNKYFASVKKNVKFDPTLKRYGHHLKKLLRLALILCATLIIPYGVFVKIGFFVVSLFIKEKVDNKERAELNTLYENKIKYYEDLIEKTDNPKKKFKYRQLMEDLKRNQKRLRPYISDIDFTSQSGNHRESADISNFNIFLNEEEIDGIPEPEGDSFASKEIKDGNDALRNDKIKSFDSLDNKHSETPKNDSNDNSNNDVNDDTSDDIDMDDESNSEEDNDNSNNDVNDDTSDDIDMDDESNSEEDNQEKNNEHYTRVKHYEMIKKTRDNCTKTITILNKYKSNHSENLETVNLLIKEFDKVEEQCNSLLRDHITNLNNDTTGKIIDLICKKIETLIKIYKQLNINEQ